MATAKSDSAIFDDILTAPKVDPLEKYANLFSGINLNELASLDQVVAFVPFIEKAWKANSPLNFVAPTVVAIPSGMQTTVANVIPVADIVDDGFPTSKKAHYFYDTGSVLLNAALLIRMNFSGSGAAGVFQQIWTKG